MKPAEAIAAVAAKRGLPPPNYEVPPAPRARYVADYCDGLIE